MRCQIPQLGPRCLTAESWFLTTPSQVPLQEVQKWAAWPRCTLLEQSISNDWSLRRTIPTPSSLQFGMHHVSIVQRAGWNMLPLPLCRPAAHLWSPEKLTFLPRGGQCLKMILSNFYIMKRIKKYPNVISSPESHVFFSPSVTQFCLCLKSRVCMWVSSALSLLGGEIKIPA